LPLFYANNVINRITNFQFSIQFAFLSYVGRQSAPTLRRTTGFNTQYRTSEVAENLVNKFLARSVQPIEKILY